MIEHIDKVGQDSLEEQRQMQKKKALQLENTEQMAPSEQLE